MGEQVVDLVEHRLMGPVYLQVHVCETTVKIGTVGKYRNGKNVNLSYEHQIKTLMHCISVLLYHHECKSSTSPNCLQPHIYYVYE